MVVDDSAIIRGFLCRYLSEDSDIEVVTTAHNGQIALRNLDTNDIEVVVLDIEMPEMDGMTALPLMLEKHPDLKVVMASTLTRKNAEISLRALQMGAVDYVPKPETARSVNANIDFRRELVEKVKAWASVRRKKRGDKLPAATTVGAAQPAGFVRPAERAQPAGFVSVPRRVVAPVAVVARPRAIDDDIPTTVPQQKNIQLRPATYVRPAVLLVGSSTGGPQALLKFFQGFEKAPNMPILITQHMPANFTAILAKHLQHATGWEAAEAVDGETLLPGQIYVAPGGKHLEIESSDGKKKARLTDDPPENFCKPAVDPLFRSAATVYGDKVMAVMLTGMGHDGLRGARELVRSGSTLYAQDEASSVVWGMPGAVATAGLCAAVLPINDLGAAVSKRLQGGNG
ncbi:protein-glutamate methylesterase/protein-glutamine glutaminase [Kordiimonas pumila]|uniref:Protein-glutamate methylesterase/protein-glutamine glutaminase n=1 Tax=Kordiimonas pumila TaxID=2161677 RepID=A0ABV7D8J5_9PROT